MDDYKLFKIAVLISLVGLLGMIISAGYIMPREVHIKDLDRAMLDQDVLVEGVVQEVKKSANSEVYFLQIMDDTGKITLVIFPQTMLTLAQRNISIPQLAQKRLRIIGYVSEYNGQLELILKDDKSLQIIS